MNETEIEVSAITSLGKGKYHVIFSNGISCDFYRSELKECSLAEGSFLSSERLDGIFHDVVGKRATKRALHLLEQMDRSEAKLREKLRDNGYPEVCVDQAIDYVKSFHYLDDARYAATYVRYHGDSMSRGQIRTKLMQKGIGREEIARAIEEEYQGEEEEQLLALLKKRGYTGGDEKEYRRTYAFLARRGFQGSDIARAMRKASDGACDFSDEM